MDDLFEEYGTVVIIAVIGMGIVYGFVNVLSFIWTGGLF